MRLCIHSRSLVSRILTRVNNILILAIKLHLPTWFSSLQFVYLPSSLRRAIALWLTPQKIQYKIQMRFLFVRNLITFRCVPIVVLNALLLSTVEKTGNLERERKVSLCIPNTEITLYAFLLLLLFRRIQFIRDCICLQHCIPASFFITAPEYLVANSHTTSGIGVFENCILSVFTCFSYFSRSWRCRQWSDKWWQLEGGRLGLASWHLDRPWILRPTYCHEFAATIRRRDPKGKGTNRKYFILSMFPQ